jgi:hypothetical protein
MRRGGDSRQHEPTATDREGVESEVTREAAN